MLIKWWCSVRFLPCGRRKSGTRVVGLADTVRAREKFDRLPKETAPMPEKSRIPSFRSNSRSFLLVLHTHDRRVSFYRTKHDEDDLFNVTCIQLDLPPHIHLLSSSKHVHNTRSFYRRNSITNIHHLLNTTSKIPNQPI